MSIVCNKHVYFIEGGDNVGKTTTIHTIKMIQFIESLKYTRITFSKYPTFSITEDINSLNRKYREYKEQYENKDLSKEEYDTKKSIVLNDLMSLMIRDMIDSFDGLYREAKYIPGMNRLGDVLNISDRGFLSTYLYQYRALPRLCNETLTEDDELKELKNFIEEYLPKTVNDINVIILNNNAKSGISSIMIDETETIEYKKNYDHDVELQTRINNSLNNIVALIKKGRLDSLPFKFYYIDIFDKDGLVRKTSEEVCSEIVHIINLSKEEKV